MEPSEIREPGLIRRLAIDVGPLRRYPAFRRLFVGQTISTFGSEVAAVAAPFQLYQLTHSTLQVGLLSLCELFPLLTLTIVGGALADAVDRRRMLLVTEVLLALVALGFDFNASLAEPRVWAIYVLVTLAMSVFSLGVAGMSTVIPRLVQPHELAAANAIENVYGSTTNVAGPAFGGVLIALLGLKGAFLRSRRPTMPSGRAGRRSRKASASSGARRCCSACSSWTRTRWSSACLVRSSRRSRSTASAAGPERWA